MQHIMRNRCGYAGSDGYTCVGAPKLSAMLAGYGMTCDYMYDRDRYDSWDAQFVPAIPVDVLESFLIPYIASTAVYDMKHAEYQAAYDAAYAAYQARVDYVFGPQSETVQDFGEALADWLLHIFIGTPLTKDPYYVQGVDPASVKPTLITARAYMAGQMHAIEFSEDVPPFEYYVNLYMHGGSYMDNYFNLPAQFRGQVTSWSPVPDMRSGFGSDSEPLTAPEEECRENFDAMTAGGFLDLFGRVYTSSYDNKTKVIGRSNSDEMGPTEYVQLRTNLICFSLGMFEPGFMEPLLPVKQPMPAWPVRTRYDVGLDGVMEGLTNLTQWKNVIQLWLNNTARSLLHIWGLRSLLIEIMKSTHRNDDVFYIDTTDDVLTWDTQSPASTHTPPTFTVHAGKIQVNGVRVTASNLQVAMGNRTSVYIWLNITLNDCDDATGHFGSVSAVLSETHGGFANNKFSVGIAGIRKLTSARDSGIPSYTLYQISQERESVGVDIVRTCKEGVLYRFTSGTSPYKALATARC